MTRSVIAGLVAWLAACGGPDVAPGSGTARSDPAVAPDAGTILVVGTSLTAGFGIDPAHAYPAVLQRMIDSVGLSYRVVSAGVSGSSSAEGLARISWLLRQRVDVLVLELGANDGLRGTGVEALQANLQGIVDSLYARYPGARLVVAGMEAPPNMGRRYTDRFREVYRDLARRNGGLLIPFLLEGVAGRDSLNLEDGIHPTAAGHAIVAETVWRVLEPVLRGPP